MFLFKVTNNPFWSKLCVTYFAENIEPCFGIQIINTTEFTYASLSISFGRKQVTNA